MRFEYFLTLLNDAKFLIGNSSTGIREAPFYDTPTIDIGTRQSNRAKLDSVFNANYDNEDINKKIIEVLQYKKNNNSKKDYFGDGKSDKMFFELLESGKLWSIKHQKQFRELM